LTKQDRHQQEDVRASKQLDPPPPSALARTQAASVGKPTLAAVHSSRGSSSIRQVRARDKAVKEVEEADKEVERLEKRREQREEGQD
jgi:hypothetical protein